MVTGLEEKCKSKMNIEARPWGLPWGSSGQTPYFNAGGAGLIPGWISHAAWLKKQNTQKNKAMFSN